MRRGSRHALLLLSVLSGSACADIGGIEAGHLRADPAAAGTSGSAPNTSGGATALAGANSGGSTTEPTGGHAPNGGTASTTAGSSAGGSSNAGTSSGGSGGGGAGNSTSGGEGGGAPCPADMVLATSTQNNAFCIDAFEVTNAQYLAFTQAHTAASTTQATACATNTTFIPSASCGGALTDVPSRTVPVVCVDWCDAAAYCSSVGKRLCGRIGDVENKQADSANADASEWYAACIGPTGRTQSGNQCNDSSFDPNATAPKAASKIPDCEGGFTGIFDMSGNVAEWENSCSSDTAQGDCNTRGGSYLDGPFALECASTDTAPRVTQANTIGIRCCANTK